MKMSRYLLFLSVFSIPFYHLTNIWGVRITTTELLFSVTFGAWILECLLFKNKIELTPLASPIMLFLGACVLSSAIAVNKFIALRETIQFVWLFGIYLLILNVAKGRKDINHILVFGILAGVVTSLIALNKCFYYANNYWEYRLFVASTFFESQPNALGSYLIGLIPLSFALYVLSRTRKWRYLIFLLMGVMIFALLATFSRGSWIGLALGMGIFFVIIYKRLLKKHLMLFFLLVFLATGVILGAIGLHSITDVFSHGSSDTFRFDLAKRASDITIEHPLIGVGPGNYNLYLPKDLQYIEIPHNMFLQVSAETGLIGLAAFLWLLYAYYKTSIKLVRTALNDKERIIRAGLIGSATAVLASGLFGWPFSHGVQEILILSMALSTSPWKFDEGNIS